MWTNEEINKLKELYCNTDNKELIEIFNKKKACIIRMANQLKLYKDPDLILEQKKRNNPGIVWTEDEIIFLKQNYFNISIPDLSKKLNKTKKAVIKKCKKLDLKKSKEQIDNLRSQKCKENGRNITFELIKEEAEKYNTKHEFQIKDPGAYSAAIKYGWIQDVCKHMTVKRFSIPQLILKDILEFLTKESCSYNDRQIIKPLEIDCYFPTLKAGWEYDGIRFHKTINQRKLNICHKNGIKLFLIREPKKRIKNYERFIKDELLLQLDEINNLTKLNIIPKQLENYTPQIIYPNTLSLDERKIVTGKKMSEIKILNIKLFEKIKRNKLFLIKDLRIEYDLKKNNSFKTYDEYKKHIKNKYSTLKEIMEKEHPHRVMKKLNLPYKKIKELLN